MWFAVTACIVKFCISNSKAWEGVLYLLWELLPTSTLDLVSQFSQFRHHFLTMVSLDFDIPILDGATRAAQLLELLRQCSQLCLASYYPIYNCDGFSSMSFPLTSHTYNPIAFPSRLGRLSAAAFCIWQPAGGTRRYAPTVGWIDEPVLLHGVFLSSLLSLRAFPDIIPALRSFALTERLAADRVSVSVWA